MLAVDAVRVTRSVCKHSEWMDAWDVRKGVLCSCESVKVTYSAQGNVS